MRATRYLAAVDSHTEGMPTRVVTGGVGPIPGATMLERKLHFEAEMDDLRLLLMREPRGHSAMSGAILQPPTRPDADWGVLFIEVSGCLPMCGHGTIGVATVLVETGMVPVTEPETVVRLDTPAGLVETRVAVADGRARSVTLRNVPSFLAATDREVDVPGVGARALRPRLRRQLLPPGPGRQRRPGGRARPRRRAHRHRPGRHARDQRRGPARASRGPADRRLRARRVHRPRPRRRRRAGRRGHPSRAGWTAPRAARGRPRGWPSCTAAGSSAVGDAFVHESVIGTRFTGRVAAETTVAGRPAIVPEITGRAWITGMGQYLLDADDPFPAGFAL